ncbi:MAG: PAS domain-containing sensor histidine kinase [Verrucomicrobiales bacterium]
MPRYTTALPPMARKLLTASLPLCAAAIACVLLVGGETEVYLRWLTGVQLILLIVYQCAFSRQSSRLLQVESDLQTSASEKASDEKRLRRSEACNQKIIENNHDCILMIDSGGRIVSINERGLSLLDVHNKSGMLGQKWIDLIPQSEQQNAGAALQTALTGAKTKLNIYWPTDKGTPKWWDLFIASMDGAHQEAAVLIIARDVTDQMMAEKAMRESEAAFRKIFEENSIGMVLVDLTLKITQTNNAISGMLGYTENDLLSRDVRALTFHEDQGVDAEGIENLLKGHLSNYQCEKRYISKRGEVVWGHLTASLIHDSDGEPMCMIQMIDNIDERKTSEKQLLAYQEQLQSLASELSLSEERERRRIATNLHDQIGQTLAFARLKLGTLKKALSVEATSGPSVAEVQGLIEQAIMDTRSLTFELSPPVLYELGLVPAVEWLARKFQKEHSIVTRFNDDGLAKPLDDNFRIVLFQAVRELLVNIVKHARATHVQVLMRRDADAIRIIIEDDGIGFDPATIHSHGDPTRGFGLFNVRERVEYLGGKVKVRSENGHGTRVTLIAPLKLEQV